MGPTAEGQGGPACPRWLALRGVPTARVRAGQHGGGCGLPETSLLFQHAQFWPIAPSLPHLFLLFGQGDAIPSPGLCGTLLL